ncbi:S8 family serine peptidase [Microbacterium testaceum]|uniref:S8 family serine peptidase n=1 Tax=Microbacterium testaceum TaxID=2033 RepID=UPI000734FD93|nr:S8 family serine peptidase [Microbacterium testaceum]
MITFRSARSRACALVGTGLLATSLSLGAALPAGATPGGLDEIALAPAGSGGGTPLPDSVVSADGPVDVFVQTRGDSALGVHSAWQARGASDDAASAAAADTAAQNAEVADRVSEALEQIDPDAEVLYTSTYSVPGIAVNADADTLRQLAERPDVEKVSRIVTQSIELPATSDATPSNAASDALTRAVNAWQQAGRTGKDVTVAVVDTGVDYTHADFGGPGTTEAYQQALASTDAPAADWFDASKYLGGWDFAGPTYNGANGTPAYDPIPRPDANPIDGPGGNHGTHVAGTAVGLGVDKDLKTFRGDYTELSAESVRSEFAIGPGSAPEAGLIALKVFGDNGGSTSLTGAALEWIAQKVASGTSIDVVNLSLGTNYGAIDDPDNAKLQTLVDAGVLPVVAAGNSGDVTDIAGSPGTTMGALTVAASSSGHGLADAALATVGDPAQNPAEKIKVQYSQEFGWDFAVAANVVALSGRDNADGCKPFDAAEKPRVAGKIVWLEWDDADVACGSAVRFDNAYDAGAVGVVLTGQANSFENGIAGNAAIPGAQLTGDSTNALRSAMEEGRLVVELRSDLRRTIEVFDSSRVDTAASFTSRGTHGSIDDVLKPDVSAPGVSVISAGNGSGTGLEVLSGTSMAAPHAAGVAALVVEAHPDWTAEQVKQKVMNTAAHDIVTPGADPRAYGPARVGVGRVDALAAVEGDISLRSVENGDLLSASFGVIDAGTEPIVQTRTITVGNDGTDATTLDLRYSPRTETPGVGYDVSPSTVTVPAGGSVDVTLTLRIDDPAALRRTLDPTMEAETGGAPRQYLADASGVLEATGPTGTYPVRLAVYAAPRPYSETHTEGVAFDGASGTLTIAGRGLDQGEGRERYRSLMVPLILGATDPDDTFPDTSAQRTLESADILAVGASSTASLLDDPTQGVLTFGLQMDGEWARMSPLTWPSVQLDVNGDTRADFIVQVQPGEAGDVPVAMTIDAVTGDLIEERPVNGVFGDQGTNVFDNTVLTMSTSLKALGYTPGTTQTTIRYLAQTRSYYNPAFDGGYQSALVDQTDAATIDAYAPALAFGDSGTALFADAEGSVAVTRAGEETPQVLVLHLHGDGDARAEIVTPTVAGEPTPTPSEPVPSPTASTPDGGATTPPGASPSRGGLASTGVDGAVLVWLGAGAMAALVAGSAIAWRRRRRS